MTLIASSSLSEADYRAQLGGSDSKQQPTPSPRIKPGNIAYAAVFLWNGRFWREADVR